MITDYLSLKEVIKFATAIGAHDALGLFLEYREAHVTTPEAVEALVKLGLKRVYGKIYHPIGTLEQSKLIGAHFLDVASSNIDGVSMLGGVHTLIFGWFEWEPESIYCDRELDLSRVHYPGMVEQIQILRRTGTLWGRVMRSANASNTVCYYQKYV